MRSRHRPLSRRSASFPFEFPLFPFIPSHPKLSNRESARRSRARKHERLEGLQKRISQLQADNSAMTFRLQARSRRRHGRGSPPPPSSRSPRLARHTTTPFDLLTKPTAFAPLSPLFPGTRGQALTELAGRLGGENARMEASAASVARALAVSQKLRSGA